MSAVGKILKSLIAVASSVVLLGSCQTKPVQTNDFPQTILWAWERPESLEFLDANRYAVAFLAQTLILQADEVAFRPRRQLLGVNSATKLIAVTRIETQKTTGARPALSGDQQKIVVERVLKTLDLKNVRAIQIDFDAAVSERKFYCELLNRLRAELPADVSLSITALASFCVGDRWFADLPVSEAVPMIFRMGADSQKIRDYLQSGKDFREPLCRHSYGVSLDELLAANFDKSRRVFVFNPRAWTRQDVENLRF